MDVPSNHDENLKDNATRQIIELGCSIEDVAKRTGVSELTLYCWTQEHVKNNQSLKGKK